MIERRKYRRWEWMELPKTDPAITFYNRCLGFWNPTVSVQKQDFFSDISPILQRIYERGRKRYATSIAHLFKDMKHGE